VPAPVKEGAPLGTLKVWRDGNVILQVPLKTADSVEKGSVTQRALDGATELMINLFRAGTEKL
jgi:D-alanyl-D-alanine carboxypeptidase (penicillin-binding protein 5/6)